MNGRRQCPKCPWRKGSDPRQIPDGYDEALHRDLDRTIAEPGSIERLSDPIRMMACHETPTDASRRCVGWLVHQLGPGNNLALRLRVTLGMIDANVQTVGPQHERFEDTLPRAQK